MNITSVRTIRILGYFKTQMKINSDIRNPNPSRYSYNPNIRDYSGAILFGYD